MMRRRSFRLLPWRLPILLAVVLFGCDGPTDPEPSVELAYDFESGRQGWTAGFADYPDGWADKMELTSDYRTLPPPLDTTRAALFIGGSNQSDDLFMFWKRRVDGLEPNTAYALRFRVEIATNAPSECAGIGGPPGEAVRLKAGATASEPVAALDGDEVYRMNIDKGGQATGGEDAVVLGHIGNSASSCSDHVYELKELDSEGTRFEATTDGAGRLWLVAGTDSGFEGTTSLYYTRIRVALHER